MCIWLIQLAHSVPHIFGSSLFLIVRVWFSLFIYSYGIGAIPVGIAVARQRLQEHAQQHQTKDINRFGNIGLSTDLGEFVSYLVFLFNDK